MKKLTFIFKFILSLSILLVMIQIVGWDKIIQTFQSIKFKYIAVAIIFSSLNLVVGAYNFWIIIIRLCDANFKFSYFIKNYLGTWGLSLFLPGRIGELGLAYFLTNDKIDNASAVALVLLSKLSLLFVITLLAGFGAFLFFSFVVAVELFFVFIVIFIVSVIIITNKKILNLVAKMLPKIITEKFFKLTRYKGLFDKYVNDKILIFWNLILSIVRWVLKGLFFYYVFLSLDLYVPLIVIVAVNSIEMFPSLIPISLSGAGIREGVAVGLYSLLNYPGDVILAAYIIILILAYIKSAAFILLLTKKRLKT